MLHYVNRLNLKHFFLQNITVNNHAAKYTLGHVIKDKWGKRRDAQPRPIKLLKTF